MNSLSRRVWTESDGDVGREVWLETCPSEMEGCEALLHAAVQCCQHCHVWHTSSTVCTAMGAVGAVWRPGVEHWSDTASLLLLFQVCVHHPAREQGSRYEERDCVDEPVRGEGQ